MMHTHCKATRTRVAAQPRPQRPDSTTSSAVVVYDPSTPQVLQESVVAMESAFYNNQVMIPSTGGNADIALCKEEGNDQPVQVSAYGNFYKGTGIWASGMALARSGRKTWSQHGDPGSRSHLCIQTFCLFPDSVKYDACCGSACGTTSPHLTAPHTALKDALAKLTAACSPDAKKKPSKIAGRNLFLAIHGPGHQILVRSCDALALHGRHRLVQEYCVLQPLRPTANDHSELTGAVVKVKQLDYVAANGELPSPLSLIGDGRFEMHPTDKIAGSFRQFPVHVKVLGCERYTDAKRGGMWTVRSIIETVSVGGAVVSPLLPLPTPPVAIAPADNGSDSDIVGGLPAPSFTTGSGSTSRNMNSLVATSGVVVEPTDPVVVEPVIPGPDDVFAQTLDRNFGS